MVFGKLLNSGHVISKYTRNNLVTGFHDRAGNAILLTAKQIRHTVISDHWWLPSREYFTYLITCQSIDESSRVVSTTGNYPHMCYNWLHRSKIGHHMAVNAHIDCKGIKVRMGD